jgi:transposase
LGLPVKLHLTPGQAADVTQVAVLLAGLIPAVVLADRGYDSDAVVAHIKGLGAEAVIPSKSNRVEPRAHDEHLYAHRAVGENFWSRVKQFRRVATRYDKTDECFMGFVALASVMVMLR